MMRDNYMQQEFVEKEVNVTVQGAKEITAKTSETLYAILAREGIILEASCGGNGTCGKCKIKVITGRVTDRHGITALAGDDGYHLACQVYPLEEVVIGQIDRVGVCSKGEIGSISLNEDDIMPLARKILVQPRYPDLKQSYSFQEMLRLSLEGINTVDIHALKELALIAPKHPDELTLTVISNEVTAVESGDTTTTLFGAAFDIGTTTVAGMLIDLNKGEVIAAAAETNPQAPFGADVVSRIKFSGCNEGLDKLSSVIRECLNRLISRLCSTAGLSETDIYLITVAGNSTMTHLLMGISPTSLTLNPYVPVFNDIHYFPPGKLNLAVNPGGRVLLLPNIASFVGADTVAAVVFADQDVSHKLTLLIDLGTNGEMVLGKKDRMVVCSTAAGPAFEGAQLSCGMRAAAGAIDDVTVTDDVLFTTINNEKPKGICGSGIIKAIAELVQAGVINASGSFITAGKVINLPVRIRERLRVKNERKEFVLAFARESATSEDIVITQGDIREIQLVKSSICTGAEVLMETLGVAQDDIEQVLIAGAFGNYIDIDSAIAIGLIPQVERQKIHPVGNAAGAGAVKVLLSEKYLERCYSIAKEAEFVELANNPGFQSRFIKNLSFPEVEK